MLYIQRYSLIKIEEYDFILLNIYLRSYASNWAVRSTAQIEAKAFVWGSITKAILSEDIWVDSSEARINGQTIMPGRIQTGLRVAQHGLKPCLYIKRLQMWESCRLVTFSQRFTRVVALCSASHLPASLPHPSTSLLPLFHVFSHVFWCLR